MQSPRTKSCSKRSWKGRALCLGDLSGVDCAIQPCNIHPKPTPLIYHMSAKLAVWNSGKQPSLILLPLLTQRCAKILVTEFLEGICTWFLFQSLRNTVCSRHPTVCSLSIHRPSCPASSITCARTAVCWVDVAGGPAPGGAPRKSGAPKERCCGDSVGTEPEGLPTKQKSSMIG